MPKGRTLTEKFQFILVYCEEKHSVSFIANKIERIITVVSNFIKNPELYGKTKRPGRPPKLTAINCTTTTSTRGFQRKIML